MRSKRAEILAAVAAFFVSASPIMAVVEFNDGGVWDIDYEIIDDVWVDFETPGIGTTVNILDGADMPALWTLTGWEDSTLNILDGSLFGLDARNRTQATVSGGYIRAIDTFDSSQATVSGGSKRYIDAHDNSQVTVSGGSMSRFHAYDGSQVTISGGSISSGTFWGTLTTFDSSRVAVSGGSIGSGIHAMADSQVIVSGGSMRRLTLMENAVLTIDGSDFAVDGTPVGYVELSSIFGGYHFDEPYRRLTGTLFNGDSLDSDFQIGHNAKILLVPEPATLLLLGLGASMLRKRKP
jgi:hypothetical protein